MKKTRAYVIGTNVSKSLSPLIFNYWFKKYKIDAEYHYKEIKETEFGVEINKVLNEDRLCGINVTIPFKEKIISHLDSTDKHSKLIGAVNCVTKKGSFFEGENTDWLGFKECIKHINNKKNAIVLGYGGSAKAIIYSLLLEGFTNTKVFNRSFEKIKNIKGATPHRLEELGDFFENGDLIINTIPINFINGLNNTDTTKLNKHHNNAYGFDLVYNYTTSFLDSFDNSKRIYGVEMLAHQAVPCFEKWFGVRPTVDPNLIEELKKT